MGAVLIRVQGIRRSIDVGGKQQRMSRVMGQLVFGSNMHAHSQQFQELRRLEELTSSRVHSSRKFKSSNFNWLGGLIEVWNNMREHSKRYGAT